MKTLHKEHLSWDRLAAQHPEEEGGKEGRKAERGEKRGRKWRGREGSGEEPEQASSPSPGLLLCFCSRHVTCLLSTQLGVAHTGLGVAASSGNHTEWDLGVCGFDFVRDGGK